jgi:hypothetical protein
LIEPQRRLSQGEYYQDSLLFYITASFMHLKAVFADARFAKLFETFKILIEIHNDMTTANRKTKRQQYFKIAKYCAAIP